MRAEIMRKTKDTKFNRGLKILSIPIVNGTGISGAANLRRKLLHIVKHYDQVFTNNLNFSPALPAIAILKFKEQIRTALTWE